MKFIGLLYFATFIVLLTGCSNRYPKHILSHKNIYNDTLYQWSKDSAILIFTGNMSVNTLPIPLPAGKYTIWFSAEGTKAENSLPVMGLFLDNGFICYQNIEEGLHQYKINFETASATNDSLMLEFRNYFSSPTEQRTIFLHFPIVLQPY